MRIVLDIMTEDVVKSISSFGLNSTYDLLDPRFGVSIDCDSEICSRSKCNGHYADLDLRTYIIHPTFVRSIVNRMKRICLECGGDVPIKRSKNYTCGGCGGIMDKDSLSIGDIYNSRDNSLYDPKVLLGEKGMKERDLIIRYILVPPPGLRPKNDSEWPSDLSHSYSALIEFIRKYKGDKNSPEYRLTVTKYYSRIATGSRGSIIDKLLSGKEGIFRGIIKGKRLNSSSRSVITGDPNIYADEVMIPKIIAEKVTVPERCFQYNVGRLKGYAEDGILYWNNKYDKTEAGDIVEGQEYYRPLGDGDYVLFNRQPSLSRDSLMSFKARIRRDDNLTISMNPIVTTPFNADFDGDEMNIFMNWDTMSQAELESLCNVNSSRSLRPIQDTITGSFLLTKNDVIVSRRMYMDCACTIATTPAKMDVATGIDLFKLALSVGVPFDVPVTKDILCRKIPREIMKITKDNRMVIKFYENLQKVVSTWMTEYGFSTSIHDCMLTPEDRLEKEERIGGMDLSSYEESQRMFSEWSYKKCLEDYKTTSIYDMVKSGSKGSTVNMSQILISVGHQYINYKDDGSKRGDHVDLGFIGSSYLDGLNSDEFTLHLVASRAGVINTGVQTSSTGYLSRRASMMMADCHVDYTGTVCENDRIISFPPNSEDLDG